MSTRPVPAIPYNVLLGRVLQFHRERLRLPQADIAKQLGILQPAYSRIERGDTTITVTQLRIITRALGTSPQWTLNEVDRWARKLQTQGVVVTDEKEVQQAALLVGLGILAAAMIAVSKA